jgi:glycosyltransferase involved in cell wall biosynthesis
MRILHVFRSPVGGLFRHVRDLARAQAAMGHDVGLICDAKTGGGNAEKELAALSDICKLGIQRLEISTMPGLGDITAIQAVGEFARAIKAEVIHGHGAKGGLFGRQAAKKLGIKAAYTPHGGSLHYGWYGPGAIFLAAERALRGTRAGLIFVCNFEREIYARKIGLGNVPNIVVPNGLWPQEFVTRKLAPVFTDLVFVGELRKLKGVDVLLNALALLHKTRAVTLTIVGEGRDEKEFRSLSNRLGLDDVVSFVGRKNIGEALTLGKILVMPSRHESLPYVVLETVAAAAPIIASSVGGIPEILPADCMVISDQPETLAQKIELALKDFASVNTLAERLQQQAKSRYSVENMTKSIVDFYSTLN